MSRDASQHADSLGFLNSRGALQAGNDLKVENHTTVAAAEAWCAKNASCEGITYNNNASETLRRVYFKTGVTLNADKDWSSLVKKTHAPPGAETQQVWVKRLGPLQMGGRAAAALFQSRCCSSMLGRPTRPLSSASRWPSLGSRRRQVERCRCEIFGS